MADVCQLPNVSPAILEMLQVHGEISTESVLEGRLIIEPQVAALAAQRANSGQKQSIIKHTKLTKKALLKKALEQEVQQLLLTLKAREK